MASTTMLATFDEFGQITIADIALLEAVSAAGNITVIDYRGFTVNAVCGPQGDHIPITLNGVCQ